MTTATIAAPAAADPLASLELRPLARGDAGTLLTVFAGMGPRAREQRFLAPKWRLTAYDVRQLTAVDGRDHVALVAVAPAGRPVGIARFIRDRDDPVAAEVAVEVVDAWQRRGVGGMLLAALAERAVAAGVRRLVLSVSADNVAVRRLLRRAPGPVSLVQTGRWGAEYAVSLDGGRR
jgi:RimJ/RimL family protein N-acetyltransferase